MARSIALVPTPPAGAVRVYRAASRRRRMLIPAVLLALLAAGGGWMWFRSSGLVAVSQVSIHGLRGPESSRIRAALRQAARSMTTLHADDQALLRAVASYPVVRAVSMTTGFPHRMTISVTEQLPVAVIAAGGTRTAAAGDGVVLGLAEASSSLPLLSDSHALPATGRQIHASALRAQLALLGAAPRPLDKLVAKLYEGPEGLTAKMSDGLVVYFGDASRARAKWLSLARVLADPSSAGARYIDVRLPQRPAAGTDLKPLHEGAAQGSGRSALAAGLDRAVGGEAVSEAPVEEETYEAPVEESTAETYEAPAGETAEEAPTEIATEEAPTEATTEEAPIG